MRKMMFNKQNIGMKGTVEFELLDEYAKDLAKAKDLVTIMESRYNDLYATIYSGAIIPGELATKVAIMEEELED